MSDLLQKCNVCSALIDEEDLFCANCGAEAPHRDGKQEPLRSVDTRHSFSCDGCGAAMVYDAGVKNLRCPFCGSERLSAVSEARGLAPRRVVPFRVERAQATQIMRQWLGRGFWRPGDLSQAAAIDKIAAVYVPYWVFRADTFSYWTADSSATPAGARGDWVPLFGEHRGSYGGLLIGSSSALAPQETTMLCPFDLARAVPPDGVDWNNTVAEQFRVQRKYARPLARQGLERLVYDACHQQVPGRARNLQINMRLGGLGSEPMMLPVWIMSYRYKEQLFRFLINGQTGEPTGQAPVSWVKIVSALAIAAVVILVLSLIALVAAG